MILLQVGAQIVCW